MKKLLTLLLAALLLCSFSLTMISCDSDDGESSSSSSSGDNNPPATTKTFSNDYFSFQYPSSLSQVGEDNGATVMFVDMTRGSTITLAYQYNEMSADEIAELDMRPEVSDAEMLLLFKNQFGEDAVSDYAAIRQKDCYLQTFTVVQAGITMYMTSAVTYVTADGGAVMLNFTIADMDASRPVASTVLQ